MKRWRYENTPALLLPQPLIYGLLGWARAWNGFARRVLALMI